MQRHDTPISLCALATPPPQLRRKEDTYRYSLDARVEDDSSPVRWSLDKPQTIEFLAMLFPDERLFAGHELKSDIQSVLSGLETTQQRLTGRWKYFPEEPGFSNTEEKIAKFLNRIITHVPFSHMCTKRWTGKAADKPVDGLTDAIRKPDLLLCEEGVIVKCEDENRRFDMRTDVYAMGEVKKRHSEDNKKDAYIELAGKVAFLLEVQDGRFAAPGIQFLGSNIILTFFDRGGSISTYPLDIHEYPKEFLRILLGVTFADGTLLGFDSTISPVQNGQKTIEIVIQNKQYIISADTLLFFSGSLHSRGTTVWRGTLNINEESQEVVVKDSWVDPCRIYTEGRILKILEAAAVKGVPELVHEQQVRTQHPLTGQCINHSTHILRSLVSDRGSVPYYLRVLTRLVSKPRGFPIFEFSSLAELLVGIIDCLCGHRDALCDAHILHRDISLFNLLFVLAKHSNLGTGFVDLLHNVEEAGRAEIRGKIQKLSRRGLLADWGFAVPTGRSSESEPPLQSSGIRVNHQADPLAQTDPFVPFEIVIPVANFPLQSDASASVDTSPLQRTGTWAWMAAELSLAGPGIPVTHEAHHDLESFFYVLLAVCLLYDAPGQPKPSRVLAECFDPFFSVTRPSTLKTVTVQSSFGWTALMLPHISTYFRPLIPLLHQIRTDLILPIQLTEERSIHHNQDFSHDDFIRTILVTLSELTDDQWGAYKEREADVRPRGVDASGTTSVSPPGWPTSSVGSFASTTVLSKDPLPRPPPIRMGTSSTSGAKRPSEDEDVKSSRLRKTRRSDREDDDPGAGDPLHSGSLKASSNASSWAQIDVPQTLRKQRRSAPR